MTHPPYHLRSNKAVDRYILVEAIKQIIEPTSHPLKGYTYVGFGGPFLEDFKVIEHHFPDIKLISLENNTETHKRQKFHRFCRQLKLLKQTDEEFIVSLVEGQRLALWFDYLGCTPRDIGNFSEAVRKAGEWSVLRITLNANMPKDANKDKFIDDFERLLPGNYEDYFSDQNQFFILLQRMIQSATTPLPGSAYRFSILNSTIYKDSARMITITGFKCPNGAWKPTEKALRKWPFFTPDWDAPPEKINLPDLSLHERLHLAKILPMKRGNPAKLLKKRLGYSIGGEESLANYAAFCRYSPIFGKLTV